VAVIVSIIAAVSDNGVIGRDNDLPWHLPADLKRFKSVTTGHPMIMGRRTWESIGCRPLPGRPTTVITRDLGYRADRAQVAHSLAQAIELVPVEVDEVFIAGGEAIYRMALSVADRMYLTRIHAEFDGDTRFPDFETDQWQVIAEERFEPDAKNRYPYTFFVYERR
jgi:dihydrofolate reductase